MPVVLPAEEINASVINLPFIHNPSPTLPVVTRIILGYLMNR
jgi:hypothetical protein